MEPTDFKLKTAPNDKSTYTQGTLFSQTVKCKNFGKEEIEIPNFVPVFDNEKLFGIRGS